MAASDDERRARLVEPDRSGVLPAGVVIVRETLRHLGLDETTASDRDLLNGAALAAAGSQSQKKARRRPAPIPAARHLRAQSSRARMVASSSF